jgi:hypothetical protein
MQQEIPKVYTLDEANNLFAKRYNGACWSLLEKADRTAEEAVRMINLAHASLLHWEENKEATPANWQRGEWLISTAYAFAEKGEPALYHAKRCLDHTDRYPESMIGFDFAYAYMAMARASAMTGSEKEAKEWLAKMVDAAGGTKNEVDERIFIGDLQAGNWYAVTETVAEIVERAQHKPQK